MEKYPITLLGLMQERANAESAPAAGPLDNKALLADITARLEHLHSLGYAHNDLTLTNICIDRNGRAVVIF